MDVLSIGNSFSQDAQRYLHQIAKADGENINVFNLYIGGCSLSTHYRNMLSERDEYLFEMNGISTGIKISMKEALLSRDWDVVTLQQASAKSICYDTYQPYLNGLAEAVRLWAPKAKIVIHQTWAYEQDSARLKALGYENRIDMFNDVKSAYEKAALEIGADFIIPSGELFQKLIESGIGEIHRDTFHASLGLGRYALGLLWYKVLTGKSPTDNNFNDFDEEILDQDISVIKKCVEKI